MNRKQRRAMKKMYGAESVEKMKSIEEAISNMSNSCAFCKTPFDKNDKTLLDSWRVTVEESGFILTCPSCAS